MTHKTEAGKELNRIAQIAEEIAPEGCTILVSNDHIYFDDSQMTNESKTISKNWYNSVVLQLKETTNRQWKPVRSKGYRAWYTRDAAGNPTALRRGLKIKTTDEEFKNLILGMGL